MKILILLLSILFLFSCTAKQGQEDLATHVDLMQVASPSRIPTQGGSAEVTRTASSKKLIKEGFVEFETSDAGKTKAQIMAAAVAANAYISSDKENNVADKVSYTLIVRIPAAKFDSFLKSATKDVRYFDHKQIDVKDVTAEYLDVETRLKTKKEIELRYRQLLNKASTIKDILSIETELGTIRTEIESAEGQLKLLADQIQYSTLRLEFYKITSTPSVFTYQLSSAFVKGWENLLAMLVMAADVWPFILIGIGLWFGFRKAAKRKLERAETNVRQ